MGFFLKSLGGSVHNEKKKYGVMEPEEAGRMAGRISGPWEKIARLGKLGLGGCPGG